MSESIEVHVIAIPKESNAHYVTQKRSRRESNPHLRFRKPLFLSVELREPKNPERINGLNGDEQDAVAMHSDFLEGELCFRSSAV